MASDPPKVLISYTHDSPDMSSAFWGWPIAFVVTVSIAPSINMYWCQSKVGRTAADPRVKLRL
jgi:hypothetical protein